MMLYLYCPYAFITWCFIKHRCTCTSIFTLCPMEGTCNEKSKVSMTVKITFSPPTRLQSVLTQKAMLWKYFCTCSCSLFCCYFVHHRSQWIWIMGLYMWNLWWIKWQWDMLFLLSYHSINTPYSAIYN